MENVQMNTRIVEGIGRGRWHGTARPFLEDLVQQCFDSLHVAYRNRDLSPELRDFALEHMLKLKPIMGAAISATSENDLLKLIFNATAIANLADNASGSPLTSLDFGLHTADPGSGGNMSTNEIAYTGYARVSVARNSGALLVTGNSCSPVNPISFPTVTGAPATAAYFSCGFSGGGAAKILYSGPITTPNGGIVCSLTVLPRLMPGTTMTLT
jgi:hypothetical protein